MAEAKPGNPQIDIDAEVYVTAMSAKVASDLWMNNLSAPIVDRIFELGILCIRQGRKYTAARSAQSPHRGQKKRVKK